MRIPTRSAPRPPVEPPPQRNTLWASSNDIFRSVVTSQPHQKRKPPPRPPPPKFSQSYLQSQSREKPKKPARPTELLTNFFSRKKQERVNTTQFSTQLTSSVVHPSTANGAVCLIDLSPPGSPTFTTRSSSDGVSVDSFGSDGNSNPSAFTSSGNTSQTESAFEDDFDFFGLSTAKKPPENSDPWQLKPMRDPFGPIGESSSSSSYNVSQSVRHVGDACFFAFNSDNRGSHNQFPVVPAPSAVPKPIQSFPTIIRAKPPKPPAPKILQKKLEQKTSCVELLSSINMSSSSSSKVNVPFNKPVTLDVTRSWTTNYKDNDSPSPPMPTIPAPAPPPEFLTEISDLAAGIDEPYGIALYDYPQEQPDDLPFKAGDTIKLIRKINDDWLEGREGSSQGMFPSNFIDIKIPLPGMEDNIVTAIYAFEGETAGDLSFNEGEKIKVLSRISEDWLYGECGAKKGQFPANFVNRVPRNIPSSQSTSTNLF